jgi:hypothetical protein
MAQLLRFPEYFEAANRARQRAQSERNPHAKQILQEIERSYHRLVEFEKWAVDQQQYNRPLLISGCSTVVLRARTSCPLQRTIREPVRIEETALEARTARIATPDGP